MNWNLANWYLRSSSSPSVIVFFAIIINTNKKATVFQKTKIIAPGSYKGASRSLNQAATC